MYCTIQTPTPKIEESLDFYTKLGFKKHVIDNEYAFSDNKSIIEINNDRMARIGIKMYKDSWSDELDELLKEFQIINIDDHSLVTGPGNCWIYLITGPCKFLESYSSAPALLGNYAGVSIETGETERIFRLFSILGFSIEQGKPGDAWFTLKNKDGFSVSIMAPNNCPHMFASPSLTYFNNKENQKNIEAIRKAGLEPWEEITVFNPNNEIDNISLRDPAGLGFLVFND